MGPVAEAQGVLRSSKRINLCRETHAVFSCFTFVYSHRGLSPSAADLRYINDCRNSSLYNVAFHKLPLERKALVVALKDIERGQEIFVDYGRYYGGSRTGWEGKGPSPLLRKQFRSVPCPLFSTG